MKVVLAGINEANLTKVETELKATGATVISAQTDVAKQSDVEALAQRTLDAFGGVHLLVNNAGVGAGSSVWDSTWNDWEWVMGVNLWGVIHGSRCSPRSCWPNTKRATSSTLPLLRDWSPIIRAPYHVPNMPSWPSPKIFAGR